MLPPCRSDDSMCQSAPNVLEIHPKESPMSIGLANCNPARWISMDPIIPDTVISPRSKQYKIGESSHAKLRGTIRCKGLYLATYLKNYC